MTVNNQNNGPKVFTSNQAQSASIGEMKSLQVSGAVFRTTLDNSAAAQVRQGLATGVAYLSQGAATVFGAMGMNQVAGLAATAGARLSQIGQMGDKPVTMTTDIKSLSTGGTPTMQANGQNGINGLAMQQSGQSNGQGGQPSSGGSPFGAGTSGMQMGSMSSKVSNGAAFGAGAGALPGMNGSTGGNLGGMSVGSANSSNPIGAAAGGNSQDQLLNATKSMQETQMSFNLQYLQLQSQMQHENRSYTAISNIMKTKHDTVKNSISNVR